MPVATARPGRSEPLLGKENLRPQGVVEEKVGAAARRPCSAQRTPATRPSTPRARAAVLGARPSQAVQPRGATARCIQRRAEVACSENDDLEAELDAFRGADAPTAADSHRDAQARARDAEQLLTAESAAMLAEYAEARGRVCALEGELARARAQREEIEGRNLDIVRQNLQLDREEQKVLGEIAEAQDLLRRHAASQHSLEAELAEAAARCEAQRGVARGQAERLSDDVRRLGAMQARIAELLDDLRHPERAAGGAATPSRTPRTPRGGRAAAAEAPDVANVLAEAAAAEAVLREAQAECERVVRDGIAPEEEEADPAEEEAEHIGAGDVVAEGLGEPPGPPFEVSVVTAAAPPPAPAPPAPPAPQAPCAPEPAAASLLHLEPRLASFESRLDALARSVASGLAPPSAAADAPPSAVPAATPAALQGDGAEGAAAGGLQEHLLEVGRRAEQLNRLWSILAEAPEKFEALPKDRRDAFLRQAEERLEQLQRNGRGAEPGAEPDDLEALLALAAT